MSQASAMSLAAGSNKKSKRARAAQAALVDKHNNNSSLDRNEDEAENYDSGDQSSSPKARNKKDKSAGPGSRSAPKYSTSGGLYGLTAMPTSIGALAKLPGQTHEEWLEWKTRVKTQVWANSIGEVVEKPAWESLKLAQVADEIESGVTMHAPNFLRHMWLNLHRKACAALRLATESALGGAFFDAIEAEQDSVGEFDVTSADPSDAGTFEKFFNENANYLWLRIKEKCGRPTLQHRAGLVKKYSSLQYNPTQKPEEFRREFEKVVNDLEQQGTTLGDDFHTAIWFNALPPEYNALRQGLNARPDVKWTDIYEAIQSQYQRQKGRNARAGGGESAYGALENRSRKGRDPTNVECFKCGKKGHFIRDCKEKKRKADDGVAGAGPRGGSGGRQRTRERRARLHSSTDDELDPSNFDLVTPFMEKELVAAFAAAVTEDEKDEDVAPAHFIFDSAATSHVTHRADIIKGLSDSPEVEMGTALRGASVMIKQRGSVKLTDRWLLKDVALIPKATVNLISEGVICDAGCAIYKDKDKIEIIGDKGKVLFSGQRSGKLWTLTVNGEAPKKRSSNTLADAEELKRRAKLRAAAAERTKHGEH